MTSPINPSKFKEILKDPTQYRMSYLVDYIFCLRKFIFPLYKCNCLVHKTIDLENSLWEYCRPIDYYDTIDKQGSPKDISLKFHNVVQCVEEICDRHHCKLTVLLRVKSARSLQNAAIRKGFVYDQNGLRFIIMNIKDYQFLWGIVWELSRHFNILLIKDYLSYPRPSGYAAVHIIFISEGILFEMQLIFSHDVKIKVPHFKYKQSMSIFNPYIEEDCHRAYARIMEDFKLHATCC